MTNKFNKLAGHGMGDSPALRKLVASDDEKLATPAESGEGDLLQKTIDCLARLTAGNDEAMQKLNKLTRSVSGEALQSLVKMYLQCDEIRLGLADIRERVETIVREDQKRAQQKKFFDSIEIGTYH